MKEEGPKRKRDGEKRTLSHEHEEEIREDFKKHGFSFERIMIAPAITY